MHASTAVGTDLIYAALTKSVGTGTNPDWIMYEPSQNEVYAFNGGSQSATVIDVATGEVTATIPLGGKPESATVDVAAAPFLRFSGKASDPGPSLDPALDT